MKGIEIIIRHLKDVGILPTCCVKSEKELKTLMDALVKTPVRCLELTMRDVYTTAAIRYVKSNYPEFTVGAGTVVTTEQLDEATEAGADFCVSPGFDETVVEAAQERGVTFLPGCVTPSEILKAKKYGLTTVKFFPCEGSGGVDVIRLYEGAFPYMSFIATGGISADNYLGYLACKNISGCGGSFMIPKDMLASGNSDGIADLVNKYVSKYREMQK